MTHNKCSGFTTTAVISVVAVVALLVGLGWYATRQSPSTPPTTEIPLSPVVQNHRSFTLQSDASSKSYQPKQPITASGGIPSEGGTTYTFSIVDEQGNAVTDFATVHEKIMHVIVVRKDLQEFQHVHPDFNQPTGQFTLANLTFPSAGPYRIFADFTPTASQRGADGQPLGVTLHEDVTVGKLAHYQPQPLTDTRRSKTFQSYHIQLTPDPTPVVAETLTTLTFVLNRNGKPVTNLEKYLSALGHTVVLREGDLEFLHTHAVDENVANQTGAVDFAVTFPTAANYQVFSQFQHQGKIITTDFMLAVESPAAGTNEDVQPAVPLHHAPQY